MNIETKAARIQAGEDSQHGVRSAPEPDKVPAIVRLRSLLRRNSQSARAAEDADAFYPTPAAGTVFPQPDGPQALDASTGQAASDARSAYEALTVPKLTVELKTRNEGRSDEDKITPESTRKDDLIDALLADDERQLASV